MTDGVISELSSSDKPNIIQAVICVAFLVADRAEHHAKHSPTTLDVRTVVENGTVLSVGTMVTTVLCCTLIAGIIKLKRNADLRDYLCLKMVPLLTLLKWVGIMVLVDAASDGLTCITGHPIVPEFSKNIFETAKPVWMLWVAVVIGAPLFEETLYRGFLFRGLERSRIRALGAAILVTTAWAALHVQYDFFEIFLVWIAGLAMSAGRYFTRSLWVPVAMHATMNAIATVEAAVLK